MAPQPTIRPFERGDLGGVAALLRAHLVPAPATDLERFLAATLLGDPWADPELPSLVAEQARAVVGFIARQPRRMELDGEPLRAVCCSHLTVAPEHRPTALGARLARACLDGPQRLTVSDSAGDVVVRLWRVLGGDVDMARACEWMLVLRPARYASRLARAPVGAVPLHVLWQRTRRRGLAAEPGVRNEPAGPPELAEQLAALTARLRLRPAADPGHLEHVLATLAATGRRAECRIVRREGRPIGLWACLAPRGGTAQVLALVTRDQEGPSVLRDLART